MVYLSNTERNLRIGLDFSDNLPDDFDVNEDRHEKYVPFAMSVLAPDRTIGYSKRMGATMTLFEIERMAGGLRDLFSAVGTDEDRSFSHFSSEAYFEVRFEYLHEDDVFKVELWLSSGSLTQGMTFGFDIGYRFDADPQEMVRFARELLERFRTVCPQCPL